MTENSPAANAEAAPPGIHEGFEIGMLGSNSGEEDKIRVDDGDRSFGGNRWPRQETLALLKIRSDMDSVFRDSTLKGPLWEEISRKLGELGYHRSGKKCKEKFENVYKYHKRTKDGRTGKSEGKTYRFFDQIQALENLHSLQSLSPPKPQTPNPTSAAMPWSSSSLPSASNIQIQVQSTTLNPTNIAPQPIANLTIPKHSINPYSNNVQGSFHSISSNLFSTSTSSSTESDQDSDRGSSKKKSKWKAFFRRLTKEVIEKQEQLQNKFLESIERCEKERNAREDEWRIQEMAQINREHEVLVQERSMAAARDAAVIAFLQKVSGVQQPNTNMNTVQLRLQETPPPPQPPPPQAPTPQPTTTTPLPLPTLQQTPQPPPQTQTLNFDTPKMSNGGNDNNNVVSFSPSPSRWPKAEVEALINIRKNLDIKYQENGPKAPLWEEISGEMRKLGYNRSSKRCKEKWENINKYFKKVKESNKRRPEDSKTCPYFHQLDAIYKEKISKTENSSFGNFPSNYGSDNKLDSSVVPLMVRPEQQRPPPPPQETEKDHQIQEDEEEDGDSEEEYDFELVPNKSVPITTAE